MIVYKRNIIVDLAAKNTKQLNIPKYLVYIQRERYTHDAIVTKKQKIKM